MYKIALVAFGCLAAAACTPTETGTVAGATTGAIVGGPVGAVVGGAIGAGTGATVDAAQDAPMMAAPGRCYSYDAVGNIAVDRYGNPILVRC